jgi:hypothetical protein
MHPHIFAVYLISKNILDLHMTQVEVQRKG